MKKFFFFFVAVFSIYFSSCKTTSVMIPGEKNIRLHQLYSEYYSIGDEYVKLENYSKAIEYYEFAMKDKTLRDAAYYKIGQCYAKNKQYDKALSVFKSILKKDPDNISLKSSVAYLTAMTGNKEDAAGIYKDLVVANPDNSETLINYISILIVLKDYETAKINLDYLEKKYPSTTQLASLKDSLEKLKDSQSSEKTK